MGVGGWDGVRSPSGPRAQRDISVNKRSKLGPLVWIDSMHLDNQHGDPIAARFISVIDRVVFHIVCYVACHVQQPHSQAIRSCLPPQAPSIWSRDYWNEARARRVVLIKRAGET